jgi:hypothetical protein
MTAVMLILGLEALLAIASFVIAKREIERSAILLIFVTAPLEVYRTPLAGYNISLFRLSLLIGAIVVLVRGRRRIASSIRQPLPWLYLVFVAVMAASLLTASDNSFLGVRLLSQVLIGALTVMVIVGLAVGLTGVDCARSFLVGAILPLLAACSQGILFTFGVRPSNPLLDFLPAASGLEKTRLDNVFIGEQGIRLSGTFGDPNHFGVYLVVVIMLALGLSVRSAVDPASRFDALTFGSLAAAATVTLLATYSRTAMLGLLVASAALAALGMTRRRDLKLRLLNIRAGLAVILIGAILVAPLAPRLAARLDPNQRENAISNNNHAETARIALTDYRRNPIAGIGLSDLGPKLNQGVRTSGAHSAYLTVAAELGSIGLLILLTAAAWTFLSLTRLLRRQASVPSAAVPVALLAAYVGFAVANATYDLWWDDFHWVLLGSIAVASAEPGMKHEFARPAALSTTSRPAEGLARAQPRL